MNASGFQRLLWMMVPVGVIAAGCADEPLTRATATIQDDLPVDGCSYIVQIGEVDYAPDAKSRAAIVDRALRDGATVEVEYRLTGETGEVECGDLSSKRDLPEITLMLL